jgi:hypothetical protein
MSIFNSSIGFGAYANKGLSADDWDDFFKDDGTATTESAEDSLKMQAQMALDAGMKMEDLKIDEGWAKAQLNARKDPKDSTGSMTTKLAIGGAVLGGILVIIFALKS